MADLTLANGLTAQAQMPDLAVEVDSPQWDFEATVPAWTFTAVEPRLVEALAPPASDLEVFLVPGPQGPQGTGDQDWYLGEGPPPDVIVGAKPGDMYLDTASGLIYKLT